MSQEKIYILIVSVNKDDTTKIQNFSVENGAQSHFPTTNIGYRVEIISDKNEILFSANLGISFTIFVMTPPGNETPEPFPEINETLANLRLPYFENAKQILIYHDDKVIFSYDICQLDYTCERSKGENSINCPQDCPITTTTTIPVSKPSSSIYIYLIIIVIIIAVIAVFFLRKIKIVR